MIYKRGDYGISVRNIDGFGKKAGLWIHENNQAIKVASFGSDEKAGLFIKYFEYLVMLNAEEPEKINKKTF